MCLAEVKELFGKRVEIIVRGCSDSITDNPEEKAPSVDRKRDYIKHLKSAPQDVLIVSASGKLRNSRGILADIKAHGLATLDRFTGKQDGIVSYYASVWTTLDTAGALKVLIDRLKEIAQQMVDALYPDENLDLDGPQALDRVTHMLLGEN